MDHKLNNLAYGNYIIQVNVNSIFKHDTRNLEYRVPCVNPSVNGFVTIEIAGYTIRLA